MAGLFGYHLPNLIYLIFICLTLVSTLSLTKIRCGIESKFHHHAAKASCQPPVASFLRLKAYHPLPCFIIHHTIKLFQWFDCRTFNWFASFRIKLRTMAPTLKRWTIAHSNMASRMGTSCRKSPNRILGPDQVILSKITDSQGNILIMLEFKVAFPFTLKTSKAVQYPASET